MFLNFIRMLSTLQVSPFSLFSPLPFRFLSMYRHRHQAIQQEHVTVTKALTHINRENKLAAKLQKQLEHEIIVLEERKEVGAL